MSNERPRHILVIDDDEEIGVILERYLGAKGYRVSAAASGETGLRVLEEQENKVDLVILDVNMPGIDGFETCRLLRRKSTVPVIMLTGEDAEADRIVGLEIGADDYMAKPFSLRELEARVKSVLRRAGGGALAADRDAESTVYRFAGFRLDVARRQLADNDGTPIPLTGMEYRLLLAFVEHPRRVLSRDQLMNYTKGRDAVAFDRSVDVQVGRLRRKLGDKGNNPGIIKTFRGEGYVFAAPVDRDRPN